MEADMLFAMHADAVGAGVNGTYSQGAHREGYAEERLRARVGTPEHREQLEGSALPPRFHSTI
jgi:hypothetical protein